jgi:predicted DNA-binding transcriptional regulator YafY
MRADRLISILLLLQIHGRSTARELAQRLEVSERTIHRDMEALGAAGVPVIAERGANGGWSLLPSYRTDLNGLNQAEVQALVVQSPQLLADLGLGKAAQGALIKLLAALPSIGRRGAEVTRERIHIDGAGWYRSEEAVPLLPTLQEAIWAERVIELRYRRGNGDTVDRLVEPLGLVAKGSVWYLIAAVDGECRNYRVSRIEHVRITDQQLIRPPEWDLAAYWEQSVADFKAALPRYLVTARIDPRLTRRLHARIQKSDPADENGVQIVQLRYDAPHEACEDLLRYGSRIEVLDPPPLRAMLRQQAAEIVALYDRP